MKKKRKLKSYVLPSLYVCLFVATFYITLVVSNALTKKAPIESEKNNINYVSGTIIDQEQAVINEATATMSKPYTNDKVTIGKYFYDYKGDNTKQENSITYHDNTYIQNTGIDYILEESFDVVSVLNGTVTSVSTDDVLGKTIEIKHDNNYVTVYQSLSTVNVKKGDTVTQGQVIGKSGTNEMDKEMGNHLHFELSVNGQIVDPTLYIEKAVSPTIETQNTTTESDTNKQSTNNEDE